MAAKTADVAKRADSLTPILGEHSLCRIFHNEEALGTGDVKERPHGGGASSQVDRQDRSSSRGDSGLYAAGIQVIVLAHVREYGNGADQGNAGGAGDKGIGGGNDFITRTHTQSLKAENKRICTRVQADCVSCSAHFSEACFELFDLGAEHENAVVNDTAYGLEQFRLEGRVLARDVHVGDFYVAFDCFATHQVKAFCMVLV